MSSYPGRSGKGPLNGCLSTDEGVVVATTGVVYPDTPGFGNIRHWGNILSVYLFINLFINPHQDNATLKI